MIRTTVEGVAMLLFLFALFVIVGLATGVIH